MKTAVGDNKKQRIWILVLGGLIVLIVALIVAIIVVRVNRGDASETGTLEEPGIMESAEDEAIAEAKDIYQESINNINNQLVDVYTDDKEKIFAVYKEVINGVENELAKKMLLLDYYQLVMAYDSEKTQGEEIMDRLLELDAEFKSVDSAVVVLNAASNYGYNIVFDEYNKILVEREKAEGVDLEMETEG